MTSGRTQKFTYLLFSVMTIALLAACATRNPSNRHPFSSSKSMFQAPTIDIDQYKSVHERDANRKDLALAVAISGGGERAGNFGVGVLLGLESLPINGPATNALQEVDYFSTVSGGGMAVAAYLSALISHVEKSGQSNASFSFERATARSEEDLEAVCTSRRVEAFYKQFEGTDQHTDPCLRRHLERGYHSNIFTAIFTPKIIFSGMDRGDALEATFAKELMGGNWREGDDLTLGHLFVPKPSPDKQRYPHWFANATVLENGAIFPFTPDILSLYKVSEYIHRLKYVELSNGSHVDFAYNIPLSLGLTASGNFPALIAPQTVKSDYDSSNNEYMHLIDGGVSDNLGLISAMNVLNHEAEKDKRKVLIVVDAYPGNFAPYSRKESSPNFIMVGRRLRTISLDGFRGRQRQLLAPIEKDSDAAVVYISFDDLFCESDDDPHTEDPDKVRKLFEELRKFYPSGGPEVTTNVVLPIQSENPTMSPFEIARKVKTSYNITIAEQDFLFAIGKYLVDSKEKEIIAALNK